MQKVVLAIRKDPVRVPGCGRPVEGDKRMAARRLTLRKGLGIFLVMVLLPGVAGRADGGGTDQGPLELRGLETGTLVLGTSLAPVALGIDGVSLSCAGSFLGVRIETRDSVRAFVLGAEKEPGLEILPPVERKFAFPVVTERYAPEGLKVAIELQAFTPFVTGSLADSSLPVVLYTVSFRNTGQEPIDASLLFTVRSPFPEVKAPGRDPLSGLPQISLHGVPYPGIQFTGRDAQGREGASFALVVTAPKDVEVTAVPLLEAEKREKRHLVGDFSKDGRLGNSTAPSELGSFESGAASRAAALACRARVEGAGTTRFVLALAWQAPALPQGALAGRTDARSLAEHALGRKGELEGASVNWHDLIESSSLPSFLTRRLLDEVSLLPSRLRPRGPAAEPMLRARDGGICSLLERLSLQPILLAFHPDIDREDLRRIGTTRFSRPGTLDDGKTCPEEASAFVLGVYTHYLATGNKVFLSEMLSRVLTALSVVGAADGNGDGLPETTLAFTGTEDSQRLVTTAHGAGLHLASLQAVERMASVLGRGELVSECRSRQEGARRALLGQLWNGTYLERSFDPASSRRDLVCDASQLAGEALARGLGLGSVLGADVASRALSTILARGGDGKDACAIAPSFVIPVARASGRGDGVFDRIAQLSFGGDPTAWAWLVLPTITGLRLDVAGGSLSFDPQLPSRGKDLVLPFLGPSLRARVFTAIGPGVGDLHVAVEAVGGTPSPSASLKEVSMRLPPGIEAERASLRVLSQRGIEPGNRSGFQGRVVHRLHDPLVLDSGARLSLHAAPADAGVCELRLDPPQAVSRGAVTAGRAEALPGGGVRFFLENPGPRSHRVLVVGVGNGASEATVRIGGQRIASTESSSLTRGLEVFLPAALVSPERVQALATLAPTLSGLGEADFLAVPELSSGLQQLRRDLLGFVTDERASRTVVVDVLPAGTRDPAPPGGEASYDSIPAALDRIENAVVSLRQQAGALPAFRKASRDRILSLLHPLSLTLLTREDEGRVIVEARLVDPARLSSSSRIGLFPPAGYKVTGTESTETGSTRFVLRSDGNSGRKRHRVEARATVRCAAGEFDVVHVGSFGSGAVLGWRLLGPFPDQTLAPVQAPTSELELGGSFEGKSGTVRWTEMISRTDRVDVGTFFGDTGATTVFAAAYVHSRVGRVATAEITSERRVRLRVNGIEVGSTTESSGSWAHEVTLQEGWNTILLQVEGRRGGNAFRFELIDADGATLEDLKWATRPPGGDDRTGP